MRGRQGIGVSLALISSATFGLIAFFSIPLMKAGMDPSSVLLYRSLVAAIIVGVVCLVTRSSLKISPHVILQLMGLGALYTMTSFGLIYSYQYISSGVATTIHFLYPIVVVALMSLFFNEKISKLILSAAIISIIGVCLLVRSDSQSVNLKGLLAIGSTVFTYAIYIVSFSRSDLKKLSPYVSMFYIMVSGALFFAIISIFKGGVDAVPDLASWGNIIGIALIVTTISGLALIKAVQLAGSTVTSILGSFEPVVATIVGVLHFREPFSWSILMGFVLIIGAVTLVVFLSSRPKPIVVVEPIEQPVSEKERRGRVRQIERNE